MLRSLCWRTSQRLALNEKQATVRLCSSSSSTQPSSLSTSTDSNETKDENKSKDKTKKVLERKVINSYSHNPSQLMQFFDNPKNWNEEDVKSGRPWKLEELRLKSNSDLHKLWFVLLKERNMLLTMEEAHKRECRVMPSEERIDKVEESMNNLESVVRERNRAYWQLEVSEEQTGARPWSFRKDTYGQYYWQSCNEHLVPWYMNTGFKRLYGPGYGRNVTEFVRRFREKKMIKTRNEVMRQSAEVRNLIRRFPDVDLDVLQRKYPNVPVKKMKDNVDMYNEANPMDTFFTRPDTKREVARNALKSIKL